MNELEVSLMESLRKANLSELGADLTDKALEAAGGIPVVGYLEKLWKVGSSVQTYLFIKKVVRFLAELKDIPQEERQAQVDKLTNDPKEQERVGETLLLILDRLNDMQKPAMVGRAFKALLKGEVSQGEFEAFVHAIDTLSIGQMSAVLGGSFGQPYYCGDRATTARHLAEMSIQFQPLVMCGLASIYWEREPESKTEDMSATAVTIWCGQEIKPEERLGGWLTYFTSSLGGRFYDVVLKDNKEHAPRK